ncbi:MAG: DUF255 domain-containing protein [Planctomycetota bacterium]|jgi:thioredoxin-related protein
MKDKQTGQQSKPAVKAAATQQKSFKSLWIIFVVFIVFVLFVFMTQKQTQINWVEDYQAGIDLAKKQNKPVLLAFYKMGTRYTSDMWENTYINPQVKQFVEANFIPILIDVTKQPDVAKLYNIDYYPTHYVKAPQIDQLAGPLQGYDPPTAFIRNLKRLLKKLNLTVK